MALADLMIREYGHLQIALVHLNHGLGESADAEEAFVHSYGDAPAVFPFTAKDGDRRFGSEK